MSKTTDYEKLLKFAKTDLQIKVLNAIKSEGSIRKAAKKLSVAHSTISDSLSRVKRYASESGYDPENNLNHPVPAGLKITSASFNGEGKLQSYWTKSDKDEGTNIAIDVIKREIAEIVKPVKKTIVPKQLDKDLLNLFTFADIHLGMLAWQAEGGDNWSLKIAEDSLLAAFNKMIEKSPKADYCIINNLGDFFHSDSLLPVTPAHRHIVDQDTRYAKLVESAIRILRTIINIALKRHKHVHIIMAEGNHDETSSVWLRHGLAAIYSNEPRVEVDTSPKPFYVHQFGNNMLCFHHGHKVQKPETLHGIFSSDPFFRSIWGSCKHTYIHTAHKHSLKIVDHCGAFIIQHPTIAARDAYASRGFTYSERGCVAITYHRDTGHDTMSIITPEVFN